MIIWITVAVVYFLGIHISYYLANLERSARENVWFSIFWPFMVLLIVLVFLPQEGIKWIVKLFKKKEKLPEQGPYRTSDQQ